MIELINIYEDGKLLSTFDDPEKGKKHIALLKERSWGYYNKHTLSYEIVESLDVWISPSYRETGVIEIMYNSRVHSRIYQEDDDETLFSTLLRAREIVAYLNDQIPQ